MQLLKHQLDQLLTIQSYGRSRANTFNILDSVKRLDSDTPSAQDTTSDILFNDSDVCVTLTRHEPEIKIEVGESSSMLNVKDPAARQNAKDAHAVQSDSEDSRKSQKDSRPPKIIALPEDEVNFNGPRKYHPRYVKFFQEL